MAEIRAARPDDLQALYRIALATGDGGGDASTQYRDPHLLGHIYAAPYLTLCPELVFVAEDAGGVGGYIVGAADTALFEAKLERDWWPPLRAIYPDPAVIPAAARTADQRRMQTIHHPPRTPADLTDVYPSHLHINLLPRLRGYGVGSALLRQWLCEAHRLGSTGVHLAVGVNNTRAIRFYRAHGFHDPHGAPPLAPTARWLVRPLARLP